MPIEQIFLFALVSCFVSTAVELSRFAKDLETDNRRPTISYISHAMSSLIGGLVFTLLGLMSSDSQYILLLANIVGCYLGSYTFVIALKVLATSLSVLKNSNILDSSIDELNKKINDDGDDKDNDSG